MDNNVKIIDMHTHMGRVYGVHMPVSNADEMVRLMDRENIEWIACAPHSDLFDPDSQNIMIKEALEKYPDRIKGYYCFNPNFPGRVETASDPGYIGFKFLADYHKTNIDSAAYAPAFEYADAHGLIILVHTWAVAASGGQYNSIEKLERVVERYKNMTIIFGHSVQGQVDEAIALAKKHDNIYLDLCDTGRFNGVIEKMVNGIGSERVLFGTDLPWYDPMYIAGCVLYSRISEKDKENILYSNAARLLKL